MVTEQGKHRVKTGRKNRFQERNLSFFFKTAIKSHYQASENVLFFNIYNKITSPLGKIEALQITCQAACRIATTADK